MNMDKLYKINKIEKQILELEEQKQSVVDMFNIDRIEDKNSITYKVMKEMRDKKYVELDDKIDELMEIREQLM